MKSYWARISDFFTGETLPKTDCPQKDAIEKMWSALREENVSLIVTSAFLTLLSHSTAQHSMIFMLVFQLLNKYSALIY